MTAANAARDNLAFPRPAASVLVGELSLENILAGPVVRAMMAADRVDAEALTAMLRSVALGLGGRTPRPASWSPAPARARAFGAGGRAPIGPICPEISAVWAEG